MDKLTITQEKKKEYNKRYRERKKQELETLKATFNEIETHETLETEHETPKPSENFFLNKMKTKAMTQLMDMTISLGIPLICKVCWDVTSHVFTKKQEPLAVELSEKQLKGLMKVEDKQQKEFAMVSSIPTF
jgi:hypothetical protein